MNELIGTGVALVTPFNQDMSVDVEGLKRVVKHSIQNNIDYLVVLGTTGESATLSKEEKQLVINTVVNTNEGRVPLVLGIGGNNTAAVIDEIKSTDLSAFTAVLSVSPYYSKPTQEGIYRHFAGIAEASSKPIILYNVPGRTASNITPETVIRLANDFKNIKAVKEAAGDLIQAMRLIAECPKGFLVISGDDMITLPTVLAGGAGVISVIGQGFPKEFSEMVQLGIDNKAKQAYALHYKFVPIIDLIFEEGNPAGIKAVLKKKSLCGGTVRLPLVEATPVLSARIEAYIDKF